MREPKFHVGDKVVPIGYDHSLAMEVRRVIPDEDTWVVVLNARIRVFDGKKELYELGWLFEDMLELVETTPEAP